VSDNVKPQHTQHLNQIEKQQQEEDKAEEVVG